MKKIHIEFSDERLITPSGLVFVGQILGKSSFVKKSTLRKDIQQANVDMLREMHIEPTALDNGFVPVDIDVTPFDMTIRNPIRKAYPVPTRVLTDMHQLWHISARKDTSSILNCGLGNSTARKKFLIS